MRKSDLKFMPEYFERYINLVEDHVSLVEELKQSETIFENISKKLIDFQDYRYDTGKWTPKEVLQHIIDAERIFAYRALCVSRLESQALLGFDENAYANNSNANNRSIENLLKEFKLVRQSTIILFESFNDDMLHLSGISSHIKISSLAIGFTIIGHAKHHLNILEERYFIS